MKKIISYLPGFGVSIFIALVATILADHLPIHLVSASVIALFIGIGINSIHKPGEIIAPGMKFTSKRILKFAIILLGASLNLTTILHVGGISLIVMIFTLATCFGLGHISGKALGLNWKMSNLISAGTGICGGSAIAAIAPVIEATDLDIAFAMSATFLFDMVMIVLFPFLGRAMGLSDAAFGLWAGTAVNDTSSVVATGYAFSEAAGDFAVMVKLTRTLSIIPVVIIFSFIHAHLKRKQENAVQKMSIAKSLKNAFPLFIVFFLVMATLNSFGMIPTIAGTYMKDLSKFLMVCALAAIGLNTNFRDMKKSGLKPMLHGFIVSALVVVVSLVVLMVEEYVGIL